MGGHIVGLCFFLCSLITKGSSSQQIFIQTNHDLHLHVPESQIGSDIFYWKFNTTNNIVRLTGDKPTQVLSTEDRVEFFPQNLSLILKNVQLRDTGTYSAVVSGDAKEETIATFEVTVEDPVSPVELSVSSVSNSSESCNFTVSCTTELYNISRSFTCDTHNSRCEEQTPQTPGHTSPSGHASSLHLYLSDQSIICNHSNHVSWTNDTRAIQSVCPKPDPKPQPVPDWIIALICVVIGALFIFVAIVLYCKKTTQSNNKHVAENTIYAEAEPPDPSTRISSEDCPSSMYSLVGPHTAPAAAPDQTVESLYAKVEKPSRHQS
ncbi:SLAM family member 5-like isoform X3 [Boleophthalmus pectinirostris]|uniref:SLAM family member 5-like isoform X3 n=1 Tax=Boleophthalmus pectinirostris TaxID=150288 RepID=UPI002432E6C2|nr:SLAM family member 5-like isoform X3 [Boleophthalmus pectinirostris]